MSDSEGSAESVRELGNSGAREETVVALPNREDTSGDKLEEFEKLLRAMLPSRAGSQEEEEEEEEEQEENESEKKIGAFLLREHVFPAFLLFCRLFDEIHLDERYVYLFFFFLFEREKAEKRH